MMAKAPASFAAPDLSVKVGGRVFQPALPVVDGSPPTEAEKGFLKTLDAFVADNVPLESRDGIQTRERVLDRMGNLCREWVRAVCEQKGLAPEVVDMAGGALFTSGSYRLGTLLNCLFLYVHEGYRTMIQEHTHKQQNLVIYYVN
jgi:hypothetical protein